MKRNILLFFLSGISLICFSQKTKSSKIVKSKKNGYYQITKVVADNIVASDEARVTFTFIGPENKPARSHIKIVCNNDSAWPVIDALGNYTAELEAGKYKMKFSVPFWYEIQTDSINLKKKTATNIIIRFESKDLKEF